MGKGDKRTLRGKIFKSSYGNVRLQGATTGSALPKAAVTAKKTPAKKAPAKKG